MLFMTLSGSRCPSIQRHTTHLSCGQFFVDFCSCQNSYKGQCHKIFLLQVFLCINYPEPPDDNIRVFQICSNIWGDIRNLIYSTPPVINDTQRRICHQCHNTCSAHLSRRFLLTLLFTRLFARVVFKGTVSRDFLLLVFFLNQFPPSLGLYY